MLVWLENARKQQEQPELPTNYIVFLFPFHFLSINKTHNDKPQKKIRSPATL